MPTPIASSTRGAAKTYVISAISLTVMLFFARIPAPEPITPAGMTLVGLFVGLVILWTFVDLMWPTFLALILFGGIAKDIYPESFQRAGIYEAGMQSFGHWIVLFALGCLILTVALHKSGSIHRIAYWFITRDIARRGIWPFTFMFMFATLAIGCFLDVLAVQIFMLGIAYEIFEDLGFAPGDQWPKILVIGTSFSAILSFMMTPISHTLPLLFLGVMQDVSGVEANLFLYMLVGIPVGLLIFGGMCLWFRLVVKFEKDQLSRFDVSKVDRNKPRPIGSRELAVNVICLLTVAAWVLPGLLILVAPHAPLTQLAGQIGLLTPLYVAIVALAIAHVGNEPLLRLREAFSEVEWTPIVFLAAIMMVAGSMGEQTTGIPQFMGSRIAPLLEGLGPYSLVASIAVLSCLLTNVANNVPVGIIFVLLGTPLAMDVGINPAIVGVAVAIGANLAFTIPPSFVPVGVAYASPWGDPGKTFKHGLALTVISCFIMMLALFPLGNRVFPS